MTFAHSFLFYSVVNCEIVPNWQEPLDLCFIIYEISLKSNKNCAISKNICAVFRSHFFQFLKHTNARYPGILQFPAAYILLHYIIHIAFSAPDVLSLTVLSPFSDTASEYLLSFLFFWRHLFLLILSHQTAGSHFPPCLFQSAHIMIFLWKY